ncbi:flippase [Candidatus Wolfebacteria bacterium]|nr:flippase [Candidatus Wolfebacteria bacterium]
MVSRLKDLLFTNRGVKQTIAKNVFWLSMSQVGSRIFRAVILIYAARVLGAAEYGVFSYVLGLAAFFTVFADIGVSSLMTRDVAAHPEKRKEYFSSSFLIKIFLLLITALLVIFIAPYFSKIETAKYLIPFVAFLVIFDGIRDFSIAYWRGREKMELEAVTTTIMNITIMAAGFAILSVSSTSQSLLFSYIASVGVAAFLSIFLLWKQFSKIFIYFDKKIIREILNNCWPIAFSGIIGTFMLNTDIVMLGWWRTAEEIGYYSADQRIVGILYTLPAIIASSIFPAVSKLIKQNEKEKTRVLNEKSISAIFSIAIPLVIGDVILAKPLIELFFGQEYIPAILSFKILIFTVLMTFSGTIISNLIMAHNQQKKFFKYVALGALGNIAFNALLIPSYGINGAAIATLLSQSIYYGLSWRLIKKIDDFSTLKRLKKIIVAAIIMGIFSFSLNKLGLNVIINIIVSSGIYFGILYLLKEEIINEIKVLFGKI